MVIIYSCHHLMIWELILVLLHNLFLLLTHISTFMFFSSFQSAKPPIIPLLHGLFIFFCCPILFIFSGDEELLDLKNHIEITADVSWSLVEYFVYNLFIVAPNQFLPLPCSEKSWVFICVDFHLALLLEWRKILACEQKPLENNLEISSEF